LIFTKQAQRGARKLLAPGLKPKAQVLLLVLETNPYQNPPPYEKIVGDLIVFTLAESISNTAWSIRCWRIRNWLKFCACGRTTNEAR